ncbi:hypothetical protein TTHERM_00425940 (macronuclear) [Tetrahymena thermophila SB210]|uniref:Uncharacterized protein n=1 Tax=Tetrahymena thermophila (strain SB210) TaxID=312017 RepID=Q23AG5_TETTS|nr:hypothetical protein TTHERM_00425940 [Tetrahymena thermophila SB210]EAR93527.1 hypothetical protein TTHERM_00425940 [Tetrahymena thermophila SB210]|eukprot:XP_001013772.1 hypothetical protein TTHERM_00425940 [Tetrahymena thermophila SB210]
MFKSIALVSSQEGWIKIGVKIANKTCKEIEKSHNNKRKNDTLEYHLTYYDIYCGNE